MRKPPSSAPSSARAAETVSLVTAEKLGAVSPHVICATAAITTVIVPRDAADEAFEAVGVDVLLPPAVVLLNCQMFAPSVQSAIVELRSIHVSVSLSFDEQKGHVQGYRGPGRRWNGDCRARSQRGRGGVRPHTVEKVIAAVRALDYPKRLPDLHRGVIRIEVILVRPETPFFSRLAKAFERIAATFDSSIAVHRTFLKEDDPLNIAAVAGAGFRRSGALILAVPEHPVSVLPSSNCGPRASPSCRS